MGVTFTVFGKGTLPTAKGIDLMEPIGQDAGLFLAFKNRYRQGGRFEITDHPSVDAGDMDIAVQGESGTGKGINKAGATIANLHDRIQGLTDAAALLGHLMVKRKVAGVLKTMADDPITCHSQH